MAARSTGGPPRPTPAELAAAEGRFVPDVLGPGLRVLFCGINPGLWSAAVGHHFARPGNRFWKALHLGGLTPRLLAPDEEDELLALGLGITNLVERATAGAAALGADELREGGARLAAKAAAARPRMVAVLGVGAYRTAFARPRAAVGPQPEPIGGSAAWLLPNPSGLNAHYQLADLAAAFADLRRALDARPGYGPADDPAARARG
jgi:double-stranded uracil-DNA glycosylase